MRHTRVSPALLIVVLLSACGSSEPPAPEATPTVAPAPTPTPPPPMEPATLHHVVFQEEIAAPALPFTSPLHRELRDLPEGAVTGAFLRDEDSAAAAVEALEALERGEGISGAAVALIEWRLAWGEGGGSGVSRRWGLCSLPCTVEDSFVATRAHHPADPVSNPRVLFAGRPGAISPVLALEDGALVVRHGEVRLWPVAAAGGAVEAQAVEDVPLLEADGVSQETTSWAQSRRLVVDGVTASPHELRVRADGPPAAVRVLPDLPARPHRARRRGVEGITEVWPWPDATIFEGGFSVKPDPAASGLQFERAEQRVLWRPTTAQADAREAVFVSHTLRRPSGLTATVEPFPLGVDVLASLSAVQGQVRIAFAADPDIQGRARQVKQKIEAWHERVPLPASEQPIIFYITQEATTVLPGGAGGVARSFSVDDEWSEFASVARAFARATLGANAALRSPETDDWLAHVAAQTEDLPDGSWLAHAFASAGEDVLGVWREWLEDPVRVGRPDPDAFLAFVAGQLPELAIELRDRLALRSLALDLGPDPAPWNRAAAERAEAAESEGGASEVAVEASPGAPRPEAPPAQAPDAGPSSPPSAVWTGGVSLHAAWHWLPWSGAPAAESTALRVDAEEGAPVSWVAFPLNEDALVELASSDEARAALAASAVVRRGPTLEDAPVALEWGNAEGLLLGVWGSGPWRAGFAVIPVLRED